MKKTACAIAVAVVLGSATTKVEAAELNKYGLDDYELMTSGDLLDVCTVPAGHEDHNVAIAYCAGFFEGGIHFHRAVAVRPEFPPIACPPEGIKLGELVDVFVAYARANPQYLSEPPMETTFRAVVNKWPCGK